MASKKWVEDYTPNVGQRFTLNGIEYTVFSVKHGKIRAGNGVHMETFTSRELGRRGAVPLESSGK